MNWGLSLLWGLLNQFLRGAVAFGANEHALPKKSFEGSKCSRFMLSAFKTTHCLN